MERISLLDSNWKHIGINAGSFVQEDPPQKFRWDREDLTHDILVLTDKHIHEVDNYHNKYKVCMLGEPRVIATDAVYDYAMNNWQKYDLILTFEKKILDACPNAVWYAFDGSFIPLRQWKIYPKSKNISIIGSEKGWTYGHVYRREIIEKFKDQFDIFGRSYKQFDTTLEPLQDYRFEVVVLNCDEPYYWSDRLTDCFHTGTVPIFWNAGKWIYKYFNPGGMFTFSTTEELESILKDINANGETIYNSCMGAIQDNYNYEINRGVVEDHFYDKYFSKLAELVKK